MTWHYITAYVENSERGVERTETFAVVRIGSTLQTEGLLLWPAMKGDSIDPVDLGNALDTAPDRRHRHGGHAEPSAEGWSLRKCSAGQGT